MKYLFVFALVLFLFFDNQILLAQWVQTNGPNGGCDVNCFAVSGNSIYTGTSQGVYLSIDNGVNWVGLHNGLPYNSVYAIAINGNTIFTGTDKGIFRSTNNGATWAQVYSNSYKVDAFAIMGNYIFAANYYLGVLRSTDNGSNWTLLSNNFPEYCTFTSFTVMGPNIFVGLGGNVNDGGVYLSTDYGLNWKPVNKGLTSFLVYSLAVSENIILAGTELGGVFISSNSGANWIQVNNGLSDTNVSSLAVSGINFLAGTEGGGIFLSSNNGASWTKLNNTGLSNTVITAIAVSGTNILAGTRSGGVFLSTNNGTSWIPAALKNSGVSTLAVSGSNVFAGTAGGVFLSTDNGSIWTSVNNGLNTVSLVASEANIIAGSFRYGVYRSTNNGTNWAQSSGFMPGTQVNALAFSGTNIFAATGDGVFRSTDNGADWQKVGLSGQVTYALTVSGNKIFAGSYYYTFGGGVWLSKNNGADWVQLGLDNASIFALAISDSNIIAGSGSSTSGNVYCSTNGGSYWFPVFNHGLTYCHFLTVSGPNVFAASDPGVFLSTDSGVNWTNISDGLPALPILSVAISGSDLLAGTNGAGVWKRPLGEIVSVTKEENNLPHEFTLSQNYPNPFNPITTINYSLPKAGNVKITVYNTLGSKVATLINEFKQAGNYSVQFNSNNLASGIYFYKLESGQFSQIKKMILLK